MTSHYGLRGSWINDTYSIVTGKHGYVRYTRDGLFTWDDTTWLMAINWWWFSFTQRGLMVHPATTMEFVEMVFDSLLGPLFIGFLMILLWCGWDIFIQLIGLMFDLINNRFQHNRFQHTTIMGIVIKVSKTVIYPVWNLTPTDKMWVLRFSFTVVCWESLGIDQKVTSIILIHHQSIGTLGFAVVDHWSSCGLERALSFPVSTASAEATLWLRYPLG